MAASRSSGHCNITVSSIIALIPVSTSSSSRFLIGTLFVSLLFSISSYYCNNIKDVCCIFCVYGLTRHQVYYINKIINIKRSSYYWPARFTIRLEVMTQKVINAFCKERTSMIPRWRSASRAEMLSVISIFYRISIEAPKSRKKGWIIDKQDCPPPDLSIRSRLFRKVLKAGSYGRQHIILKKNFLGTLDITYCQPSKIYIFSLSNTWVGVTNKWFSWAAITVLTRILF